MDFLDNIKTVKNILVGKILSRQTRPTKVEEKFPAERGPRIPQQNLTVLPWRAERAETITQVSHSVIWQKATLQVPT